MESSALVEQELERRFVVWAGRAARIGAVLFLLIAPLDFLSVPALAPRFLWYRLGAAAALLLAASLFRRSQNLHVVRLLVLLGVLLSAVTIELMILDFGGYRSPYLPGMILLGVVMLSLLPAGAGFHALLAATVFAVYALPLLAFTTIDSPRDFFTQSYLFAAVLGAAVFIRSLHRRTMVREILLTHEMAERELRLSQKVEERTEELLRAAAEWRTTFDSTGDMILLLDGGDRIVRANLAVQDYTGTPLWALNRIPAFDLFPRSDLPGDRHPLVRMRRTGQRSHAEFRERGSGIWFLMTAEPIREGAIQEGGAVLTVRDVTSVKVMEEVLIQARDDWAETFDSIQEGITIHDENFVVQRANAAARRLLGAGAGELEGRKCFNLFHGTDAPIGGCPSCESTRTGCSTTVDLAEPHLGCYLEVTALPRPSGGMIHVVHDVTDRKNLIDEVAAAAERMRRILESSPFGIFIVGEELRVEFANPAILAITGYPREEFEGSFLGSFPGCAELGMGTRVEDALAGASFRFGPAAFHCRAEAGPVVGRFTGLPFAEGGQRKVIIFVEDLTDLKEGEDERQRLSALLLQAQKMESIGTLASGIAHDFNNVLLGVIGLTDAAGEQLPADHPARAHLEAAIGAAERGSDLVRQILAFSRQQDLQVRPVDVGALVGETRTLLRHVLPKNIAFDLCAEGDLPRVQADPVQLEQVLMNLAVNARDAMPQGGTLAIETAAVEVAPEDPRHIGVPPGAYVLVTVRDTGSGMSPEVLSRIFDPFFTTKEPGKGTGLGLATAYGIISQHGGVLRVESEPGKGSAFFVFLPVGDGLGPGPGKQGEAVDGMMGARVGSR